MGGLLAANEEPGFRPTQAQMNAILDMRDKVIERPDYPKGANMQQFADYMNKLTGHSPHP